MALLRRRILIPSDIEEEKKPEESSSTTLAKLIEQAGSADTINKIEKLHKIATRPLSLLTSEQCEDLDYIRKLSLSCYDTEAYSILHSEVTKLFNSSVRYSPHTVGSFFVGCMVPSNLSDVAPDVNPGCSLMCSASGLPPSKKKWGFCSQNVLWCILSSSATAKNARSASDQNIVEVDSGGGGAGSFDFIYMTHIPSSSKAVIFVDYKTYEDFPGFTRYEKARLIYRMKITDIKLLSYDHDEEKMVYRDLIGKAIKVQKIKSRADPRDNETVEERTKRRAQVAKQTAEALSIMHPTGCNSEVIPIDWKTATILAVALLLLIILGLCASFAVSSLTRKSTR